MTPLDIRMICRNLEREEGAPSEVFSIFDLQIFDVVSLPSMPSRAEEYQEYRQNTLCKVNNDDAVFIIIKPSNETVDVYLFKCNSEGASFVGQFMDLVKTTAGLDTSLIQTNHVFIVPCSHHRTEPIPGLRLNPHQNCYIMYMAENVRQLLAALPRDDPVSESLAQELLDTTSRMCDTMDSCCPYGCLTKDKIRTMALERH